MTDALRPEPDLPEQIRRDPLSRMRAYQIAAVLVKKAWHDAKDLKQDPITHEVGGQLYRAVGSITANLAEGYSRSSGRDRARIFEYALGSARESMAWYESARPVLGDDVVALRLDTLEEIRRLLLAAIPRERDRLIKPAPNHGTRESASVKSSLRS